MLLTQGLPESEDLKTLWLSSPSPETWEQLLLNVGSALAEFHRAGFSHGDCKWSNLVHSRGQFYFVDLEAVKQVSKKSPRIARDLARFTVNAEDMGLSGEHYESFLGRYAEEVGSSRELLVTQILGPLQQLRSRHLSKYGSRGHRLI